MLFLCKWSVIFLRMLLRFSLSWVFSSFTTVFWCVNYILLRTHASSWGFMSLTNLAKFSTIINYYLFECPLPFVLFSPHRTPVISNVRPLNTPSLFPINIIFPTLYLFILNSRQFPLTSLWQKTSSKWAFLTFLLWIESSSTSMSTYTLQYCDDFVQVHFPSRLQAPWGQSCDLLVNSFL